jgi:hypothetical protein
VEGPRVSGTNTSEKRFFTSGCSQEEMTMIDRNTPSPDDEQDSSWVWIGGALAAVFLMLGLFAIFWGGNMPVNSAKLSPPASSSRVTTHTPAPPEPTTTGQVAR